jgi:hypothetical protein
MACFSVSAMACGVSCAKAEMQTTHPIAAAAEYRTIARIPLLLMSRVHAAATDENRCGKTYS